MLSLDIDNCTESKSNIFYFFPSFYSYVSSGEARQCILLCTIYLSIVFLIMLPYVILLVMLPYVIIADNFTRLFIIVNSILACMVIILCSFKKFTSMYFNICVGIYAIVNVSLYIHLFVLYLTNKDKYYRYFENYFKFINIETDVPAWANNTPMLDDINDIVQNSMI